MNRARISLVKELAKRDVLVRYRGSALGIFWSLINPLLLLAVYGIVFSVIFNSRWQVADSENQSSFAVILFAGLIIHGFFAECFSRSPSIILNNSNYVKKVVFPLEILVPVILSSAFFHFFISFLVLIAGMLITGHSISWPVIFLPLVIVPTLLMVLGLSWILSSLGVYLRDIGQVTGILITVMLFISPVFYEVDLAPPLLKPFIYLNPISVPVEEFRNVIVFGRMPDFLHLSIYSVVSLLVCISGYLWFQKTRKGFADVI